MYLVKRTFRREDDGMAFFKDDVFEKYQRKMYDKMLAHDHHIVEGHCKRHIQVFFTEEQYQRWSEDPMVRKFMAAMSFYNVNNNINFNEVRVTV